MRSCSTSPARRARRAGGAPSADWRGLGIPPRPRAPGGAETPRGRAGAFTFIAPRRPSCEPLTRARVRLLGPCFKTGRVGGRHRRRPRALASLGRRGRGTPGPDGATRPGRTGDSPPRPRRAGPARGPSPGAGWGGEREGVGERSRRGRGGPAPPDTGAPPRGRAPSRGSPRGGGRREGGERGDGLGSLGPGMRRALLPGGCNTREGGPPPRKGGAPPSHLPRRPSQPSRSRSRRTAAAEMRPAAAGRRPGGGPPATPPPAPPARPPAPAGGRGRGGRVEGPGGTGKRERSAGPPARPDPPPG